MKLLSRFALSAFVTLLFSAMTAQAALICPTTPNTNSDCGYIFTIGSGNVITGAPVAGAFPYDGGDDALVGVINNSGSTYTGSLTLTGHGNGGGIFDFDGDGICTYTHAAYCATAPTGYEGPLNSFSGIGTSLGTGSIFDDTGTVNIVGLASGATTYFSLESAPGTIMFSNTPEPSSWILLATGALGVAGRIRRKLELSVASTSM